jgi:hypothetical protein
MREGGWGPSWFGCNLDWIAVENLVFESRLCCVFLIILFWCRWIFSSFCLNRSCGCLPVLLAFCRCSVLGPSSWTALPLGFAGPCFCLRFIVSTVARLVFSMRLVEACLIFEPSDQRLDLSRFSLHLFGGLLANAH